MSKKIKINKKQFNYDIDNIFAFNFILDYLEIPRNENIEEVEITIDEVRWNDIVKSY